MIRRAWLPLVLLAVWEIGARLGWIGSTLVPPPGEIAAAIVDWARDGALVRDTLASVSRVSAGFALAAILGIGVGSLVALLPVVRRNLLPLIELLRPMGIQELVRTGKVAIARGPKTRRKAEGPRRPRVSEDPRVVGFAD